MCVQSHGDGFIYSVWSLCRWVYSILVVLNDFGFWKHDTQLLLPGFLRIVVYIRQLGSIHSIICIEWQNEYSVWWMPEPVNPIHEVSPCKLVLTVIRCWKKGLCVYIQSTFYELWAFWKLLTYSMMKVWNPPLLFMSGSGYILINGNG